jgi:hypothetical protein
MEQSIEDDVWYHVLLTLTGQIEKLFFWLLFNEIIIIGLWRLYWAFAVSIIILILYQYCSHWWHYELKKIFRIKLIIFLITVWTKLYMGITFPCVPFFLSTVIFSYMIIFKKIVFFFNYLTVTGGYICFCMCTMDVCFRNDCQLIACSFFHLSECLVDYLYQDS